MANPDVKQDPYLGSIVAFAKVSASFTEDVSRALLGFIPNGLNVIYDRSFKTVPMLGSFFSHRWVEQVIKLCTGITIGQGLAADLAHFVFKPFGFVIGVLLGNFVKSPPTYKGQIGKLLYRLSAQTVAGAILGLIAFTLAVQRFEISAFEINVNTLLIASGLGALLGLSTKALLLIAMNMVSSANAATVRRNVQRAKELNAKLKLAAKHKAKSLIMIQAQDIIVQMNGPQSQQHLDAFFKQEFESIATSTYQRIHRHFNYLTDRACHGDLKALKRLQELSPNAPQTDPTQKKKPFDTMIHRIFNARAILKLKDAVDTAYDRWQYRFLSVKETV